MKFQRVSSEDHRTPVRGQTVKQIAEFRSSSHAPIVVVGKGPRVKFQRVSSEDCRTPFRGQAVEQSAEMRSALEFFATAQSCRERSLETSTERGSLFPCSLKSTLQSTPLSSEAKRQMMDFPDVPEVAAHTFNSHGVH